MVVNGNANVISDNSLTDPTKHAELFRYLENLKKDEDGWRNSLRTIVSNSLRNVEEHFLLLQVIEDFLQRRYSAASPNDVQLVRELLLHWMKVILDPSQQKLPFIVNKMAHIFSMVFAVDFPMKWPSFFEDLFFSNNLLEPTVVRFYMKVLLAIDSEVVDRDIQRSKEEADRNIKIKDAMREICIQKIAQSWPTIMNNVNDDSVQCLVLEAIAAYVDWIDVDLIANDTVMSIVIQRLGQSATSEAASNAVCALLQKGMPPEKKVKLVITLMDVLRGNNLLAVTEDSDEDEVLRVGSLVNTLGLVLIDVYTKWVSIIYFHSFKLLAEFLNPQRCSHCIFEGKRFSLPQPL
ncbi:unnamed protein product [Caenorhabditis auriculariae]|uniref:Exportin-T n=1 Tax=Caenorhabditis auriculariae TaxID=2777116 RepID=A0A8S1H5P6_9PELO|nr:unnamed protein product [Caenorhabditis auriculariae]